MRASTVGKRKRNHFFMILFKENSAKPFGITEGHLECSLEECSSHELVPVICGYCYKNYCFRYFVT